jgi:hypothetical protein
LTTALQSVWTVKERPDLYEILRKKITAWINKKPPETQKKQVFLLNYFGL